MDVMAKDKKAVDGRLVFVLLRGLGSAEVVADIDKDLLTDLLLKAGAGK
jgi:3-dehydroquinate synthetase